jgi:hypothetical protein
MKRMAFVLLLLSLTSQANAQVTPTPPPAPIPLPSPVIIPNCPMRHYGTVNNIWFWGTGTCPLTLVTGFGQTNGSVTIGCKASNPNECNSAINPILPYSKEEKFGSYELKACAEPQSTAAERDDKLQKIIKECEKLAKHLKKILDKPDEHSLDQRTRIGNWRTYLLKFIVYLETSTDSVENKIAAYCTSTMDRKSVVESLREHEAEWSKTYVDLGMTSKRAHILNKQQTQPLVSADALKPIPTADFKLMNEAVYKVNMDDLAGTPTIYFKTFTFAAKTNPDNYMHYGVQVSDAGDFTAKTGKFKNRNAYGHLLSNASGTAVFLVSSVNDLSVPVDPDMP